MKYQIGNTYRLPFGQCRRELLATFDHNGTTRYQFDLLGGERKALMTYTASQLDRVNPLSFEVYPSEVFRSLGVASVVAPVLVSSETVMGINAAKTTVSLYHPSMVEVAA